MLNRFVKLVSPFLFSLTLGLPVLADGLSPSQQELNEQLAAAKGQVVYIDFWASWCTPCRKSFPWLNEMQAKYQAQGFKVISVNVDADKELAEEFLAEVPANFAVVYDPQGKVARSYKVKGMPSSYILNRDGELVASHVGFRTKKIEEYEQQVKSLLAQK
jgi:thiol-disulfide isomerase/thioredoxin